MTFTRGLSSTKLPVKIGGRCSLLPLKEAAGTVVLALWE